MKRRRKVRKRRNPAGAPTMALLRTAGALMTAGRLVGLNPKTGRLVSVPCKSRKPGRRAAREVTIYANFLPFTIFARKGKNSHYAGQNFRHTFKSGGRITGLPDGSVRLYPRPKQRLWSQIPQR